MKKLLPIIVTTLFFISCGNNYCHTKLANIDSLIAKDMYDSAYKAVESFDTSLIKNENNRAYYNLMYTQLCFWKYEEWTDSQKIAQCINHYLDTEEKDKLARAFYFKGQILNRYGNIKDAILMMKHAEYYSENIDDYLIKSRIQMMISSLNAKGGETKDALAHSRQAVEYAEKSGNKIQMVFAYSNLAFIFNREEQMDSSIYYKKKYIPLLKYVPRNERGGLLANLGTGYDAWGTEKAKEYVMQSLEIKPFAGTYRILADIYLNEKDFDNAVKAWKQGLEICGNDMHMEINILNDMREYKLSIGENEEAANLSDRILKLDNILQRKWDADSVKEVQAKFKNGIETKKAENGKARIMIVASIIIIAISTAITVYYRIGRKRMTETINRQNDRIEENSIRAEQDARKIEKLEKKEREMKRIKENQDRKIRMLETENKENIIRTQTAMADRFAEGHRMYVQIKEGGNMLVWTKAEKEAFIEYYTTTEKKFKLPERTTINWSIYNILTDMRMEDSDIAEVMVTSPGALRAMKSRMRK